MQMESLQCYDESGVINIARSDLVNNASRLPRAHPCAGSPSRHGPRRHELCHRNNHFNHFVRPPRQIESCDPRLGMCDDLSSVRFPVGKDVTVWDERFTGMYFYR